MTYPVRRKIFFTTKKSYLQFLLVKGVLDIYI